MPVVSVAPVPMPAPAPPQHGRPPAGRARLTGQRTGRSSWAAVVAAARAVLTCAVLTVAVTVAVTSAAVLTAALPAAAAAPGAGSGPSGVLYVVLPHPDDEFETWSLVQDTPELFKVFVLLTHGEQTANCDPDSPGYDSGLEPPPSPLPQGRWTPSCEQARLASWRGFLSDMSAADPSVPGSFVDSGPRTRLAGRGASLCRRDADPRACASRDRTAHLWTDDGGRGALVVFNLGDGDLTPAEVVWAMQVVRDNRRALGIDPALPSRGVVGSYANRYHGVGFRYDHPDHRAVDEALWSTDLRLGPRTGATAAEDPRAEVTGVVDDRSLVAAFGWDGTTGAHTRHYGWLWRDDADPVTGGRVTSYQVDRTAQRLLFHRTQHFWRVGAAPG